MKREILRMEHVTRIQADIKMLDDLTLNVFEGEIVGILGLSGSGKTLISRILAGYDCFFTGDVYYKERPVENFSDPVYRQGVFCVLSVDGIIPDLSVAENIFVMQPSVRAFAPVRLKKICQESGRILDILGLSHINPRIRARCLSHYEQCLVQLARALAVKADLIVLDTIFEMLSREEQIKMEQTIQMLKGIGISFMITSRFSEYLSSVADRIIVLRDGCNVRTFYRGEYAPEKLLRAMLGFHYENTESTVAENKNHEILRLENIFLPGLNGFSMSVKKGEAVGLWELRDRQNQALCTLLLGEQKGCCQGEIYLDEVPFVPRDIPYAVKKGIGAVRSDALKTGLVPFMSAADNILFPAAGKLSGWILSKGIYKYLKAECAEESFAGCGRNTAGELNVYDQYRVLMEKWILARPSVFLCINPCVTSDIVANHISYEYMNKMMERGTGILIASSNLSYMTAICSRIIIFQGESVWKEFSREEFGKIGIEAFI